MDRVLIHWYWKMNWNWCFHSSAAGRVSSEEGNFDQLRTKLCLKHLNEKLDNKTARKREISGGWELKIPALFLYFFLYDVVIIATRARVSISVNPSPIWCSVRLPLDPLDFDGLWVLYVCAKSRFRGTGNETERPEKSERRIYLHASSSFFTCCSPYHSVPLAHLR